MKEFEKHTKFPDDNKVNAAEQRQVKTQIQVASIKPHPGHTVFEFDLSTGLIKPAKIESVSAHTNPNGKKNMVIRKKIIQRQQCLYCSALNKKNAIKKFSNMYQAGVDAGVIIRPGHDQGE